MPRRREEDAAVAAAFGRRLREIRLQRELTQERLAEAAGVHPTFVSNLERGYRVPTLVTLIRMADALEIGLPELLDRVEP
ncbi:MAG TPA: helix-turn-helix transcriptional regulator [Iamia sp.]|nr:helix-turn-helix transcriptional regulator [Iamia sp.]